ncbi:MAG: pyruvate dehydrogenase complex E1 component subunit beta [Janthinobacterium lividum]
MAEVIMPKMGDAMEEGTLLEWKKQDGETVKSGDVIAEIETDKSNVEIEAEEDGVLHTQAEPGAIVPVGKVIAVIGDVSKASNGTNGTNGSKPQADSSQETVTSGEGIQFKADTQDDKDIARIAPTVHVQEVSGATESMTYADAIRLALQEELDRDEKVFILGEEIGQYQGTFKITKDFLEKYGPERIVDTPISEAGMVGLTVGAAMMGLRPIIEFMTLNFALVAWDGIINHAAKILYMSGGQFNVPCVLRGPGGVGVQLSAQHSQDLAHWYANTPGLKVVAPATPADAKGLLKAAIRDNNPVVFNEHAGLYRTKGDVPTDPNFIVPLGVADVKRVGKDVTIVSYSRGTILALAAAEQLAAEGIDAEVVDLRSLQPIDLDTIINSVKKTHRAVVVQEQWLFYGIAAEFAAQISNAAFDYLDAPVERVAGAFVPMPYARTLELAATPHEPDIIAAVKKTLERSA